MPRQEPTPPAGGSEEETSADKLFKTAFELFLRNLVELVRPEVAARLDLDHARILSPKLFADFRKQGLREPDLVAEAETVDGESELVVVHVDVEGAFRLIMDERMMEYAMHLVLKTGKPVVSIAVFLTGGPKGIEVREVTKEAAGWTTFRFFYLAFGLSGSLAEEYVDRPQPLAAALAALMRSEVWDRVEQKLRCLTAISRAKGLDLSRQYVLTRVVDNYLELSENESERFKAELERGANKEVRDMVVTWEEALEESRAKGEDRGKALGRLEAARKAILLLASECHREVPPSFEEKVRAIDDLDRLYRILERIVKAPSIAELDLD
jgi:hypothetical protein